MKFKKSILGIAVLSLAGLAVAAESGTSNRIRYNMSNLVVQSGGTKPVDPTKPTDPPGAPKATLTGFSVAATVVGQYVQGNAVLSNTGAGPLSLTAPTAASVTGADFSFGSTSCGASLVAGGTCNITVKFSPSSRGAKSGALNVSTQLGTQTLNLSAVGLQAEATLTTAEFRDTEVGQNSLAAALLKNGGDAPLQLTVPSAASITGSDFSFFSTTCSESLAAGSTCGVVIQFLPLGGGSRSGTLSIETQLGTKSVDLTGGTLQPQASLAGISFPSTIVGQAMQGTAVLSNAGTAPLTLTPPSAASVSGTDFSFVSTTCGSSLAAGASCDVVVKFLPTSRGAKTGGLNLATQLGARTYAFSTAGLQGVLGATVPNLDFGAQPLNTKSADRMLTLRNDGDAPLTVTSLEVTPSAELYPLTGSCSVIPVSGTCTVGVAFNPTATGAAPGTLTINHDGAGASSTSWDLLGSGAEALGALTATVSNDFGGIGINTTGTRVFKFQNTGTAAATGVYPKVIGDSSVTLTSNTCGTQAAPTTVEPGANCSFSVNYTPTSVSALPVTSIQVVSSAKNSPHNLAVTGSGIARTLVLTSGSGTFTVPINVSTVAVLQVAGGGGGGTQAGGGGGAGGVIYSASYAVTGGATVAWSVGAGGAGSSAPAMVGAKGGNTVFGTQTAVGGGGGASSGTAPGSGGSGGGGSYWIPNNTHCTPNPGGAGTAGQGTAGGKGTNAPTYATGGGGGGAVSAGGNYTNCDSGPGVGGNGGTWTIGGTAYTVGGGGGGGTLAPGSLTAGGTGGGGKGGRNNLAPTAGTSNTGGGGGGGGYGTGTNGAKGGNGILVVSW